MITPFVSLLSFQLCTREIGISNENCSDSESLSRQRTVIVSIRSSLSGAKSSNLRVAKLSSSHSILFLYIEIRIEDEGRLLPIVLVAVNCTLKESIREYAGSADKFPNLNNVTDS